jgi:hypothetical protein
MPSQAHAALSTRLDDIEQLMDAHAAVGGTERGRRYGLGALNRAAVLLLSAHLEGYLEDLLEEAVTALNPGLSGRELTRRFANPSTGNIDGLFAVIGLNKPSNVVSWQRAGNDAVKDNINQLVETRNSIAHGATGVGVSKAAVERYQKYVVGFARGIDNLVRERVETVTGTEPWTPAP